MDEVYGALVLARIPAARYHGGMKTAERTAAQQSFMKGGRRMIMVATSAFGMGIDKPDIRFIMHFQAPASLEQYVQEAGRAGRDGRVSRCVLLFDPADLAIHEFLQAQSSPTAQHVKRLVRALAAWAAEERTITPREIALSAGIPATIARALCAELESLQVLTPAEGRRFAVRVSPAELAASARDLANRLEILRRQDAQRLRAIAEYAETPGCRSAFLRRYFGEESPPACGHCDRCRSG